jgi:NTE family protein
MGNPAIFPLIYNCDSRDVVVVHINPLYRGKLPRTTAEILNRINEISFNASLMREMRAIRFVTELIDEKLIVEGSLRRMLIHSISANEEVASLAAKSKLNTDIRFLAHLRDAGRRHAEAWLAANFYLLGHKSTIEIRQQYL